MNHIDCKDAMGDRQTYEECPRKKKSKPDDTVVVARHRSWENLPRDILLEVFAYLNHSDVVRASSACINWRQCLYFSQNWRNVSFSIEPNRLEKARYMRQAAGYSVVHANAKFNSLSFDCIRELFKLLECLSRNLNLRSFLLESSHCHMEMFHQYENQTLSNLLLKICERPLQRLSIGFSEVLLQDVPVFLKALAASRPQDLLTLGVASMKDDPTNYLICNLEADLLTPFKQLQILSIDYDYLNDQMLHYLSDLKDFKRLVVLVHGIVEEHPGTTEGAWQALRERHPLCRLRLSLVHAFDEVNVLHDTILRKQMPLSHLRVLFCERMNFEALRECRNYKDTLVSLMWVDSHNAKKQSFAYEFIRREEERNQRDVNIICPLLWLVWHCKQLQQITLFGYKYHLINWVGITRIACHTLTEVNMIDEDIVYSTDKDLNDILLQSCKPLKLKDLHPVLSDPSDGDSDEYSMPILYADLA